LLPCAFFFAGLQEPSAAAANRAAVRQAQSRLRSQNTVCTRPGALHRLQRSWPAGHKLGRARPYRGPHDFAAKPRSRLAHGGSWLRQASRDDRRFRPLPGQGRKAKLHLRIGPRRTLDPITVATEMSRWRIKNTVNGQSLVIDHRHWN
jgi:hypothetical protein